MKRRPFLAVVAMTIGLAMIGQDAGAAEFSPTAQFSLSDNKSGANPELTIQVAQDTGEEELQAVSLEVPAGFTLPVDAQIPNGTTLGTGTISIHVGPRCRDPRAPLSGPANVPVNIREIDTTSGEKAEGAVAKWLVDIQSVTSIPLLVKGSPEAGYTLAGNIPPNNDTCPPFAFNAKINKTAAGVEIIKNPATGGNYTFGVTFTGVSGSEATIKQAIEVVGPGGTTAGRLTAAEKKKCKKIKNAKRRRKCLKRQRAD